MTTSQVRSLRKLARLYGVQTDYYDVAHCRQRANVDSLLMVLQSLGASITTVVDAPVALRDRQQGLWRRVLEPVAVSWGGEPIQLEVRLPSHVVDVPMIGHLTLETGEQQSWKWCGADLRVLKAAEIDGTTYVVKSVPLPGGLPWGYHKFTLEVPGRHAETLIISAPTRAYHIPDGPEGQVWGAFVPLYSLYTQNSWGSGDFSALEALVTWVNEMGGGVVATLPLLGTFLDKPFEPSPYVPVSRLVWNEFYLDVTRVPELQKCPSAQALMESSSFQEEIDTLRGLPLVDYRRQMELKRRVLEELCQCLFSAAPDRLEILHRFTENHPFIEDYACFRAVCEKRHTSWKSWPQPLRQSVLKKDDYDEETKRYHLYVQWLAHQQFQAISESARAKDLRLYLDLPLGVHPDGYDVWRNQGLFTQEASGGAPPDTFFSQGQNWGFPPLHPENLRQQNYNYYIACLRHNLRHADILRIDHVMSLHRLFWIPKGMEARQGLYVRYPAEEFYAILALESHRNRAIIVGEDLGTVPPEVRPSMARHGIHRMYVVQYELAPNSQRALPVITSDMVTSLNTHDMLPFAAFWQGMDIQGRLELSLWDKAGALNKRTTRQTLKKALVDFLQDEGWTTEPSSQDTHAVLTAALNFLSASLARIVLVNLEDLWLETEAQNTPGTPEEFPNWRRKARHSLDTFSKLPQVVEVLQEINQMRKQRSAS